MPAPRYAKNSELYADTNLAEGRDYARRHHRHERFDDSLERTGELPRLAAGDRRTGLAIALVRLRARLRRDQRVRRRRA